MEAAETVINVFRQASEIKVLQIVVIVAAAWLILLVDQKLLPLIAGHLPARIRMHVLAAIPIVRLIVMVGAVVLIFQRVVEPTLENMVALFAVIGVGLGFALKDYTSGLIAGAVSLYENPYRPGDWVTIDGAYGEVQSTNLRTVQILTPDDTQVTIPHTVLWDTPVYNANCGSTRLQCVAHFYLLPDHDGAQVRRRLTDVALSSPYVQLRHPVSVVAAETRWGTHYRLRAYPIDPRQQFEFITDLTEGGKAALRALGVAFAVASAVAEDS